MSSVPKSKKKPFVLAVMLFALFAALFGAWFSYNTRPHEQNKPPELKSGYMLPKLRAIGNFKLVDDHDQPFDLQSFKGYWSFVFFGFSHCPKLCPTSLSQLNKTYHNLLKANANPMPQVVFVSVDPERDTPKVLKKYLDSFNSNFIGLTGSKQAVKQFSQRFDIVYDKVKQGEENYLMNHSGTLMLVDPQGRLAAMFNPPFNPAELANDYLKVAQYYTDKVHKHSIETNSG